MPGISSCGVRRGAWSTPVLRMGWATNGLMWSSLYVLDRFRHHCLVRGLNLVLVVQVSAIGKCGGQRDLLPRELRQIIVVLLLFLPLRRGRRLLRSAARSAVDTMLRIQMGLGRAKDVGCGGRRAKSRGTLSSNSSSEAPPPADPRVPSSSSSVSAAALRTAFELGSMSFTCAVYACDQR
eukprot:scaffold81290_cov59-Phaeocystis_antarctica.AAC.5